jgi:hypothetical protein
MAKKANKSMRQIQDALLTNTGLLKQPDEVSKADNTGVTDNLIQPEIFEKFEILANFEKTSTKDLINSALHHYIKLKALQLEQAMKLKGK